VKYAEKIALHDKLREADEAGMLGVIAALAKVSEISLRLWCRNILKEPSFVSLAAVKAVVDKQGSEKHAP
jgi:hypothetical protein